MSEYDLYVYCRREGVTRDSGHEATCEAASDDEAFSLLYPKAVGLKRLGYYDEVGCTIKQGDRIVHQFQV